MSLRREDVTTLALLNRWTYENRFLNWLRAEPWRVHPLSPTGWRYWTIYRAFRRGSYWEGRWLAEPQGRLRSVWSALTFPHVHAPWE